jgi:hypothetical protein
MTCPPMLSFLSYDHRSSRLDLTAPTRDMGPRKLLKEGLLSKSKSGRKLNVFLCNDIMVLTDAVSKALYRMVRVKLVVGKALVLTRIFFFLAIAHKSRRSPGEGRDEWLRWKR